MLFAIFGIGLILWLVLARPQPRTFKIVMVTFLVIAVLLTILDFSLSFFWQVIKGLGGQ